MTSPNFPKKKPCSIRCLSKLLTPCLVTYCDIDKTSA